MFLFGCRLLKVYAPTDKQPKLGRKLEELTDEEKPIYEFFSQEQLVDKLINFLTLEENKGKDKFDHYNFSLFKVNFAVANRHARAYFFFVNSFLLLARFFTRLSFHFQGLFRNFDDSFLPLFKRHLERLVADTKHDTHECSQRCAAEIIAGLVRGSKHWTFEKVCPKMFKEDILMKMWATSKKIRRGVALCVLCLAGN